MENRFFKSESPIFTARQEITGEASKRFQEAIDGKISLLRKDLLAQNIAPEKIEQALQKAAKDEYDFCMAEFQEKLSQKIQNLHSLTTMDADNQKDVRPKA